MTRVEAAIVEALSGLSPACATVTSLRMALGVRASEVEEAARNLIALGWVSRGHMAGAAVLVLVAPPAEAS